LKGKAALIYFGDAIVLLETCASLPSCCGWTAKGRLLVGRQPLCFGAWFAFLDRWKGGKRRKDRFVSSFVCDIIFMSERCPWSAAQHDAFRP